MRLTEQQRKDNGMKEMNGRRFSFWRTTKVQQTAAGEEDEYQNARRPSSKWRRIKAKNTLTWISLFDRSSGWVVANCTAIKDRLDGKVDMRK